jgi:prepilin-type N-terminal cleavage/methylation domain-containing protein
MVLAKLLAIRKNHMKRLNNDRGMTLVEVLLSITILGMLGILFTGVFINAFALINLAGDLNRTGYTAALVAENAIGGLAVTQDGDDARISGPLGDVLVEDITIPVDVAKTVTVTFPLRDITVSGNELQITSQGKTNEVTIEVFIPDE